MGLQGLRLKFYHFAFGNCAPEMGGDPCAELRKVQIDMDGNRKGVCSLGTSVHMSSFPRHDVTLKHIDVAVEIEI